MNKLLIYRGKSWGIAIEFKLQDFWIGVYWRKKEFDFNVWICIIPCFPIHYWSGYIKDGEFQIWLARTYPHLSLAAWDGILRKEK